MSALNLSPCLSPSDEEFDFELSNIIHDEMDGQDNIDDAMAHSLDFDEVMLMEGISTEELSTWLNKELDKDEADMLNLDNVTFPNNETCDESSPININDFECVAKNHHGQYSNNVTSMDQPKPLRTSPLNTTPSLNLDAPATNKNELDTNEFDAALTKLALSMRRTEQSRAEILRQRNLMLSFPGADTVENFSNYPSQESKFTCGGNHRRSSMTNLHGGNHILYGPKLRSTRKRHTMSHVSKYNDLQQHQPNQYMIYNGFAGLLHGEETAFTEGLDQSRRHFRDYMFKMDANVGMLCN